MLKKTIMIYLMILNKQISTTILSMKFIKQKSIDNSNNLHHTVPFKFHYNLIKNCVFDKQNVLPTRTCDENFFINRQCDIFK